jgi:acetyl esterase/lipase
MRIPKPQLAAGMLALSSLISSGYGAFGQDSTGGHPNPEELASTLLNLDLRRNVPYADDRVSGHRLSLLLPRERSVDGPVPLIVWIDGGGWTGGDHENRLDRVVPFVRTGRFAVASIGYRDSSVATWPGHVHDCKAAIRWLRANADTYGYDPERIALMGIGPGGHLAALVGLTPGIEILSGDIGGHPDVDESVRCVIDIGGPTDFLQMDDHLHPSATLRHDAPGSPEVRLVGGSFKQQAGRVRLANPLNFVPIGRNPDFLIIHGRNDLLVPYHQSILLQEALLARGDEVVMVTVTNGRENLESRDIERLILAYLDHQMHGIGDPLEDRELTLKGQRPPRKDRRPDRGGGGTPPRGPETGGSR